MTSWLGHLSERTRLGLLTLVPILALLFLLIFLPPDGNERAMWAQFIGRFHPQAVHLPIALLLLVPVLEFTGRKPRFSHLRPAADFVLALATFSAVLAAALGWCLARSGGYSGSLMTQHMWGGVFLALFCWIGWVSRGGAAGGRLIRIYPIALAAAIVIMTWTGYRGGQLVRGEDHLTEVMPAGLRSLLGVRITAASANRTDTFYGARIQPIFAGHCFTCHGPHKHKSNLRLDSYGSLMRGGKHGAVIKAADFHGSELLRRITLPASNDDFMPKGGKPPLSPEEVKLIELWIAAGASDSLSLDAIKGAPTPKAAGAAELTFEQLDAAAVAKDRANLGSTVAQLRERYPNILDYESRASANLVLNASLLGERFRDADLAVLAPIAGQVVVADFSRTAITDHSAPAIAAMKRLRVLRLMHTKITDSTVQALSGSEWLESLSVFDTSISPAVLPTMARLPKLRHLYVGETSIRADGTVPDSLKNKILF